MDRWLFWPTFVSVGIVAVLNLVSELPGPVSFITIPLLLTGYAAATIIILVAAVYFALKKRRRKCWSLVLMLVAPILLWPTIDWATDYAHLGLTAGLGYGQLGSSSESNGNEFKTYDWSVGLAGGPNKFLIHDVTDEIALPLAQHIHPSISEHGLGEECAGKVRHLLGHYFVCTF